VSASRLEIRDAYDRLSRLAIEVVKLTEEGTIFRCTLNKGGFRGIVDANTYLVGPPSVLFADIAQSWRGWTGTKAWQDRDYALTFKAHSVTTGPVTLNVEMRLDRPPEFTSLASSLLLESASLDRIARDVAELFREDKSLEFLSSLVRRK
jgi:Family of unknown function (DUF6228)